MRTLILGWCVAVVCGVNSSATVAQESPTVSIESHPSPDDDTAGGTHPKWLHGLAEHIDQVRRQWGVPGLAVGIVADEQVVFCQGFGEKLIGSGEAVDEQTLFAIASNTKAFTAASLAMLIEEHDDLDWDDHVSEYLPWMRLQDPLATVDLRIRDLLCHRSGLGTFSGDLVWWGTSYTPQEVLRRARYLEPASPFRAKYGYSNLMFLAAGQVIEEVSKQSWNKFVEERIFRPLRMRRTITSTRDLIGQGNYATPHKTHADHSEPLPWLNWDNMAAAGGIISCAEDMTKWLRLQLRRGGLANGDRLFSSDSSHQMWLAHTPIPISEQSLKGKPETHFRSYGLGWSLSDYRGHKVIGHGGGYDGMYSQVVLIPEQELGIVVLTNSMTSIAPALTRHVMDLAMQGKTKDWSSEGLEKFRADRKRFSERVNKAITPVADNTAPAHALEAYTGRYVCPLYGAASVELEDSQLVLRLLPNPNLVADLEHLHYETFVIRWRQTHAWFDAGTAHFISDSQGQPKRIELNVPNDDMWFYELNLERND